MGIFNKKDKAEGNSPEPVLEDSALRIDDESNVDMIHDDLNSTVVLNVENASGSPSETDINPTSVAIGDITTVSSDNTGYHGRHSKHEAEEPSNVPTHIATSTGSLSNATQIIDPHSASQTAVYSASEGSSGYSTVNYQSFGSNENPENNSGAESAISSHVAGNSHLADDASSNESATNDAKGEHSGIDSFASSGNGGSADAGAHAIAFGDEGKKPFNKKRLLIILGIVIAVLAVVYFGMSVFFMSHFEFNSTLDGANVAMKDADDVNETLSNQAQDYSLTISERGGVTESILGSSIGFNLQNGNQQIQNILESQNPFAWPASLFSSTDYSGKITYSYDEGLLNTAIWSLACMNNENAVQPQDAYIAFDQNQSKYIVVDSQSGTATDTNKVSQTLTDAVLHGITSVDLDASSCYLEPTITSDNPDLVQRCNLLDQYTPFALTYTFSDGSTEQLNGDQIFQWLTIADDGSYTVDEDALENWVNDFADRHNTVGSTRTFTSVDGNTYTVSGGTYGWSINKSKEIESIKNMLETKQSETREPYWKTQAVAHTTGTEPDWGNTYIEVNRSTQHIFYVKDGQLAFQADVVTGLPTPDKQTPAGVYSILEKMRDKTLTGEMTTEGVPEYETPVSYWMRVTWSGVGFHDASWQPYFGGTRYKSHGSHGCINMSLSDISSLYPMVDTGTPVVIHD